jgi:hypothetical protein
VPKKNENDNIKEFQDLFASAKTKEDWSAKQPKKTIDLTYNPGSLPTQLHTA